MNEPHNRKNNNNLMMTMIITTKPETQEENTTKQQPSSQKTQQAQTKSVASSGTMTTKTKTTATGSAGERMIAALEGLLSGIQSQNLTVHEKDVAVVNRCFGCGNNTAVEFGTTHATTATSNVVATSQTFQALQGFLQALQKDPTRRHFVVDQDWSTQTEDAIWLSIPKWQYDICQQHSESSALKNPNMKTAVAVAHLQCVVTTVRSLERSVFYQCYNSTTTTSGNWKVQEGTGPRGSAMVTLDTGSSSNSSPEKTTTKEETTSSPFGGIQAVFSDLPRHVAYTGQLLAKLSAEQTMTNGDVILRVFRCAPRPSLQQGIATVLHQRQTQGHDNVFDLWIRHVEIPENMPGIGTFVHTVTTGMESDVSLLQLLTEVQVPESLDSSSGDDDDNNMEIKLAQSLDFVVASTMHPVPVNRTARLASSPALVQDEAEESADLACTAGATTTASRSIEPVNTIHDDGDHDMNASNQQQQQPSFLQTPAASVPNEFSSHALLSQQQEQQQQHSSLVTPLVAAMAAAANGRDELYRNANDSTTPAMLVLGEEDEVEELLTSLPRCIEKMVDDSPTTTTSGSEMDNEKGGGGADGATTTTMASTNKDSSMNSDDDDDGAPPMTSVETTTMAEQVEGAANDVASNKQTNKPPASKKAARRKGGAKKKQVPAKDDKEASAGTQQKSKSSDVSSATVKASDSTASASHNNKNEVTKDNVSATTAAAATNDAPVSTTTKSGPPPPQLDNDQTAKAKKKKRNRRRKNNNNTTAPTNM